MNLHVFRYPDRRRSTGARAPFGLPPFAWPTITTFTDWTGARKRSSITWTGCWVRSVENTYWHQPLYLIFDSETMPQWFGMPDEKDLPSTFSIEYVRAWKVK